MYKSENFNCTKSVFTRSINSIIMFILSLDRQLHVELPFEETIGENTIVCIVYKLLLKHTLNLRYNLCTSLSLEIQAWRYYEMHI